jgi:hypothetical protein
MALKDRDDWVFAGVAGVDSGQLMVCDPCYIDNSEWVKETMDVPRERYALNAEGLEYFGKQNAEWIWQFQYGGETYETPIVQLGEMTINQLRERGWLQVLPEEESTFTSFSYNGACHATLSKEGFGQLNYKMGHAGAGVAFSSGWGDGVYGVFIRKVDGRNAEARIVMIEEETDEDAG